jgi:hypothetical protein
LCLSSFSVPECNIKYFINLSAETHIENFSCCSRRDLNYVSDESEQIHLWSTIINDDNWKMELREIKRCFWGRNMKCIFLSQISKSLCRFLSTLFNSTVSCWDYVASMINEWMSMVHCWHDTENRERQVTVPHCLLWMPHGLV